MYGSGMRGGGWGGRGSARQFARIARAWRLCCWIVRPRVTDRDLAPALVLLLWLVCVVLLCGRMMTACVWRGMYPSAGAMNAAAAAAAVAAARHPVSGFLLNFASVVLVQWLATFFWPATLLAGTARLKRNYIVRFYTEAMLETRTGMVCRRAFLQS